MRIVGFIISFLLICSACQTKPSSEIDFENLVDKISYGVGYCDLGEEAIASNIMYNLDKDYVFTGFADGIEGRSQLSKNEIGDLNNFVPNSRETAKKAMKLIITNHENAAEKLKINKEPFKLFIRESAEWTKNRLNWKYGRLKFKRGKKDLTLKRIDYKNVANKKISDCFAYALGYQRGVFVRDIVKVLRLNKDMVITGFIDGYINSPQLDVITVGAYGALGNDFLEDDIWDLEKLKMERRVERRLRIKQKEEAYIKSVENGTSKSYGVVIDDDDRSLEEKEAFRNRIKAWVEKNKKTKEANL